MANALTIKVDAVDTSVAIRPFEENIEDTPEYVNPLVKRFYGSLLEKLSDQYSLLERPSLVQTEESWAYRQPLTADLIRDVVSKIYIEFGIKKHIPWYRLALKDIEETALLPLNWDGYGSPPPGMQELQCAKVILGLIEYENFPQPHIVPISGGGIQLEWQYRGRELELEIVSKLGIILFLRVHEDGTTEEDSYPLAAIEITRKLLRWLFMG